MSTDPNVLLVVLDTARADDVFSATPTVMPTVADIAGSGTVYRNTFATAPWTLPSHGSIFTGTYPSKHGAHGEDMYLAETNRTLSEAFSEAGYDTHGVSNNTWVTEEFGFDAGFDTFWKGWQYYQSETDLGAIAHELGGPAKAKAALDRLFDGNPAINAVNLCYSQFLQPRTDSGAARTTDRLESWLGESRESPFFLFVNYLEPHIRYRPPREHAQRFLPADADYEEAVAVRQRPCAHNAGEYELSDRDRQLLRALYRGELSYVDDAIARLRETLETTDQWEDTIMIIVGDHGENVGDHGFLGHQYNIYDTLLHVPMVIHGGAFERSPPNDDLIQLCDLVPTILDETGVEDTKLREQSQGQSFHPSASGSREFAFSEYLSPQPPVETLADRFEPLPEYARAYDRTLRAVRTDEYKLIVGSDGSRQLYHTANDPDELIDCAAEEPERVEQLEQTLTDWLASFTHAESDTEMEISEPTEERLAELGYL